MVGLTLSAIIIAGSIDGLLWKQREERRAHRQESAALQSINEDLAAELTRARVKVERLRRDLAEARQHVRVLHADLLRDGDRVVHVLRDGDRLIEGVRCPYAP